MYVLNQQVMKQQNKSLDLIKGYIIRKFKAVYAKQYTDSQGQAKTSWKTLGFANEVEKEGKVTIHLTLDAIPTGAWDGEVKLFLQDEQQQGGNGQQGYQAPQGQGMNSPVQHEQYQPQGQQQQQPNQSYKQ